MEGPLIGDVFLIASCRSLFCGVVQRHFSICAAGPILTFYAVGILLDLLIFKQPVSDSQPAVNYLIATFIIKCEGAPPLIHLRYGIFSVSHLDRKQAQILFFKAINIGGHLVDGVLQDRRSEITVNNGAAASHEPFLTGIIGICVTVRRKQTGII